jgi:TetR/AcrR family transcriptional repressor of bet genes
MDQQTPLKPGKREDNKEYYRQLLIEATMDSIYELGIADTSVTSILKRAGVSRGMINLHFKSKDQLLIATIAHVSKTYYDRWFEFIDAAGQEPAEQLEAMIEGDFSEAILNDKSVAIWFAFRGESRSHKPYAKYTDTRDKPLIRRYLGVCEQLVEKEGAQNILPMDVVHGVLAILEGMWLDFYLHSDAFNRNSAKRICFTFLAGLFPKQFTPEGCLKQ